MPILRRVTRTAAFLAVAAYGIAGLQTAAQSTARPIRSYRHASWKVDQGLPHDRVQAVAQTLDGYLWLGTPQGLARFDGFTFSTFDRQHVPVLRSNDVRSLLADRDGNLWIGTETGGVVRLRDDKFLGFGAAEGVAAGPVRAIAQDAAGAVWIAVASSGLFRFDGQRFVLTAVPTGTEISALAADVSGLFAGTRTGLIQVADDRVIPDRMRDFPVTDVDAVAIDRSGTIWAGGRQGVTRLVRGRWAQLNLGTPSGVTALREDTTGVMWIGSDIGGVYRSAGGTLEHFGRANGLTADRVHVIFEDWDGNVWIGTDGGLDRLTAPKRAAPGRRDPPVHIEQLVVDGHPVQMPNEHGEARLSPGIANLEIHYTGLSLTSPEAVRFRYRLEGYDQNWIDAGVRRVAYYTNLGPGQYRFVVMATTNPGVWGPSADVLVLHLPPYFYQTYSFYAVFGAAIVLLTVGTYWVRTQRMRSLAQRLQVLVDERTAMLERINQELQRLTTIDGLTSVANRRRFDDVLETEWRRARRANTPVACIMIDIDNFKAFNDRYGHLQGDECQKQIAAALRVGANRAGDLLARYGGEEFAVILPETGLAGAETVAEMLRARVEGLKIPHDASSAAGVVTISAGVASLVPRRDEPPETLVAAADRALYRAKRTGKNRVAIEN